MEVVTLRRPAVSVPHPHYSHVVRGYLQASQSIGEALSQRPRPAHHLYLLGYALPGTRHHHRVIGLQQNGKLYLFAYVYTDHHLTVAIKGIKNKAGFARIKDEVERGIRDLVYSELIQSTS